MARRRERHGREQRQQQQRHRLPRQLPRPQSDAGRLHSDLDRAGRQVLRQQGEPAEDHSLPRAAQFPEGPVVEPKETRPTPTR